MDELRRELERARADERDGGVRDARHAQAIAGDSVPSATATVNDQTADKKAMTANHRRTRGSPGLSARNSAIASPMQPPMTGGSDCGPSVTAALIPDTRVLYQSYGRFAASAASRWQSATSAGKTSKPTSSAGGTQRMSATSTARAVPASVQA